MWSMFRQLISLHAFSPKITSFFDTQDIASTSSTILEFRRNVWCQETYSVGYYNL